MTADLGLGANMGMEDAVSLCNTIHRELAPNRHRHPSSHELSFMFAEFQAARHERVKSFVELSGKATRMHTYDNFFGRVFVCYIAPYLTNFQVMGLAKALAKAPKLDYVPLQTINENAAGWRHTEERRGILLVARLAYAAAGVTMAYAVLSWVGLAGWALMVG